MKTTVDYSKSPAKHADAMNDIHNYLGDRYDPIAAILKKETNPHNFQIGCSLIGIEGFPVEAWYDHFHGGGSYETAWAELEEFRQHKEERNA